MLSIYQIKIGGRPVPSETDTFCRQLPILSVFYTDPNLKISTFTLTHSNFYKNTISRCNLLGFIAKWSLKRYMTIKLPHLHENGHCTTRKDELFLVHGPVK
jgi:hypothetical protein